MALERENAELRTKIGRLKTELIKNKEINEGRHRNASLPNLKLRESLGDPNAKIAILEFSDYQCPFCAKHNRGVFEEIKEKYINTGIVQYQVWDFPLEDHPRAKSAANAARCAENQGKYWQMNKRLFTHPGKLNLSFYLENAKALGLDIKEFQDCLTDRATDTKVIYDISYGREFGIEATPSFLIGEARNGVLIKMRRVRGAKSLAYFDEIISSIDLN